MVEKLLQFSKILLLVFLVGSVGFDNCINTFWPQAPPGKSFLDTEDDNGPDAVSNAVSEAPEKGTVGFYNL